MTKKIIPEKFIRLPYFDWDKAKFFYYVTKLGSLSEAARFLNISQPALSKKITILEDHLRCKLFIRKTHGLDLTRRGAELFTIIEQAYLALKGFSYNTSVMMGNGEKRKIRISTSFAVASYILNEHLINYNQVHPEIIFELIGNDQVIDIVLNDVDLAVRPYDKEIIGIEQEHLFTLEKRLFASSNYINKYGEPQTIEELKDHRFVAFGDPKGLPYADVNWALKLGMPKDELNQPVFISNSLECIVEAAEKGIGIIGGYDKMRIIRESSLINILPNIKDSKIEDFIMYPSHLKNDSEFMKIKNYLIEKLFFH